MRIREGKLKEALLQAIADKQASVILSAASWKPVSIMDLVREEGLPPSSAYRKVKELMDQGLVAVARTVVTKDGKKYDLYKGAYREITVHFRRGSIEVDVLPNRDVLERAFRLFHSIAEES